MLMLMLGYGIYVNRSLEAVSFLGQYFVKFQPEKYDFNLLYRGFFMKKKGP
jgi:hypothetical protein